MGIVQRVSSLALHGAVLAASDALGLKFVGEGLSGVVGFLQKRFRDHSQQLTRALAIANDRAWRSLEIALAGDSWWQRCRGLLTSGDEKGFRDQVQAFLAATPLGPLPSHGDEFRGECLRQLRAARKAGLLTSGKLEAAELAEEAGSFARFADISNLVDAEWQALAQMAVEVRQAGYSALAQLLEMRTVEGSPLLVTAARYFFRRAVETDRELFQGLSFARLEQLGQAQSVGFASLATALEQHGDRLEELLGDVRAVVVETHKDVLNIQAELAKQGQQIQELGQAVLAALEQHQLERRELHPADSLSIRNDEERRMVRALVARYRALPAAERKQLPALLNAVGKLEVVTGEFEAAQRDFQDAAALVVDPASQAEAHHNAYRAALERRAWPEALAALQQAAELAPERFAPFPLTKLVPERILGAGGFGVAFLCRNRHSEGRVVVKTLRRDGLDRDLVEVFREAQVLEELDHPAIIRVRDCDYADPARTRPFLVMDYFPGQTLSEFVERSGPLTSADLIAVARLVAEGLHKAHTRGILHRDVKPANLLVRRVESERGGPARGWQVKLIDFGLALRSQAMTSTLRTQRDRTLAGSSIAGTLEYAAPEQMGLLPGVAVGPPADIYGFGKTCCYALFRTAQPTFQDWQKIAPSLAELLGQCLQQAPKDRPANFAAVLRRLDALPTTSKSPAVVEVVEVEEEEVRPPRPTPRPPARSRRSGRYRDEDEDDDYEDDYPRRRSRRPVERPARKGNFALGCLFGVGLIVVLCAGGPFLLWRTMSGVFWNRPPLPVPQSPPGFGPRPAPKPAEPITTKELPQVVKKLATADVPTRTALAERLAVTPPSKSLQPEVTRAMEKLLELPGKESRLAAIRALGRWGNKDSVPQLLPFVSEFDGDVRAAAMDALAALQDERAIKPIADRLKDTWDHGKAVESLKKFGAKAESALWPLLDSGDFSTQAEAIKLLEAVGTEASVPRLEKIVKDGNPGFRQETERALKVIRERTKKK